MLVRPHMTVNCLEAAHSVLVLLQEGHFVLRLPDRIQEMPLVVVPHCCCCLHTCTPCLSTIKSPHATYKFELQFITLIVAPENYTLTPLNIAICHSHVACIRHQSQMQRCAKTV